MSTGGIVKEAVGVVTGGLWELVAILAMMALVFTGGGWWLAERAGDRARAELLQQKVDNDQLRDSIREQNRAVDGLAKAKADAEARGALAQQLAAATGKRFDGALAKLATAKATTCADAMPAVNQLWKDIQ